jgi:hypothetical protein
MNGWWWALLALVVAGAIGTWLWLRRRGDEAEGTLAPSDPAGAPAAESAPDDHTSTDDGDDDDDWPSFPVLDPEPTSRG